MYIFIGYGACEDSSARVGSNDDYQNSIYCDSGKSCQDNDNIYVTHYLYCRASYACEDTTVYVSNNSMASIDSNSSDRNIYILASALASFRRSTIYGSLERANNTYLICSGEASCVSNVVYNVNNVFGFGYRSLYNAHIECNSQGPLNVYLYAQYSAGNDDGFYTRVNCSRPDEVCNIYCYSMTECMHVEIIGNCSIIRVHATTASITVPAAAPTGQPCFCFVF